MQTLLWNYARGIGVTYEEIIYWWTQGEVKPGHPDYERLLASLAVFMGEFLKKTNRKIRRNDTEYEIIAEQKTTKNGSGRWIRRYRLQPTEDPDD